MTAALVTGAGNPGGIGEAVCRALARDGVRVAFTVETGQAGAAAELAEELEALSGKAVAIEIDLAAPSAATESLAAASDGLGCEPEILVNNAAVGTTPGLDGYRDVTAASFDRCYAVNVRATALLSCEFARRLGRRPRARVINLTSGQSKGPMPGELAYVASKGALEAFTVSLADELAPLGITVNAVSPGVTDTGWITPELREELLAKHPMGRLGQPDDIARLVAFLAGEAAGWITGQVLYSEGGFRRS